MTNVATWTARTSVVELDPYPHTSLTVAIAEHEDGSGRALMFQIPLRDPNNQARRLGFDTYCILTHLQNAVYGGVESVALDGQTLRIRVTPSPAEELSLSDDSLEVKLEVNGADLERLCAGLKRVFAYGNPERYPREILLERG